jgi:PKD repeat protein
MSTISAKKILLLGFIVVILIAIPLSVYIAQKQQQTITKAAESTSLSFKPPKKDVTKVGEIVSFDIMLDPGARDPPNQVSFDKLIINYEPLFLEIVDKGLVPTTAFSTVLEEPVYNEGSISVTLSIGQDPTKAIISNTKIATISFKTLASTDGTKIVFATGTQVLSVGSEDQAGENVLSTTSPAIVTLISPTPGPTTAPQPSNIVCTGLGLDRSATGIAPYSITFTGSGNASIGTITKASFNFGDGPVQDVLEGEGIGKNSVSVQKAHTYINPGSYTASVIFTGSDGSLSSISNCTQAITVSGGIGGLPTPTPLGTDPAQITPPVIPTEIIPTEIVMQPSESPLLTPIPPTGPSNKLIGIGIVGTILTIVGGIIFFSL